MTKTKLSAQKFAPLFGDWWWKIKPFFEEGGFDKIFAYLRSRRKLGITVTPASANVFRAFEETRLTDLKVVICAMCPYHSLRNDQLVADGLALSCRDYEDIFKLQPSLDQLYDALEKELYDGLLLEGIRQNDLTYLARQGVFLYNAALTTEVGKAGAHMDLWNEFTTYVFEEIIAYSGVPVIFLGKEAAKFQEYLAPWQEHHILTHPASATYKGIAWDSKEAFKKVNQSLKQNNGYEINWIEKLPF